MDIVDIKRKWLWPIGRMLGLLPVSFKDCKCGLPPASEALGHDKVLSPQVAQVPQVCACPRAVRSVAWLVYSMVLMCVTVPCAAFALLSDRAMAQQGNATLRMATPTDALVTFFDISSVAASATVCLLQAAFSQGQLFKLLAQLQHVDRLLSIHPPTVPGALALWLSLVFIVVVLDISLWTEMGQGMGYVLRYMPFYGLFMTTVVMEVLFIDEASAVHRRFVALNQRLEDFLLPSLQAAKVMELDDLSTRGVAWIQTTQDSHAPTILSDASRLKYSNGCYGPQTRRLGVSGAPRPTAMSVSVSPVSSTASSSSSSSTLQRLTAAHHLLCESAVSVARRYGLSLLGDMLCLLLHLVITAYFFIRHLLFRPDVADVVAEESVSTQYTLVQACWLALHLGRMIMVVLPCSRARAEASRTGTLIGVYLNATSHPCSHSQRQLETFSTQLLHHRVDFNACGLFELGLPLVVSILGAVTTYLVVLLQLKSNASTNSTSNSNATTATAPS